MKTAVFLGNIFWDFHIITILGCKNLVVTLWDVDQDIFKRLLLTARKPFPIPLGMEPPAQFKIPYFPCGSVGISSQHMAIIIIEVLLVRNQFMKQMHSAIERLFEKR